MAPERAHSAWGFEVGSVPVTEAYEDVIRSIVQTPYKGMDRGLRGELL